MVIVDASLLPVFAPLLPSLHTVTHVVVNGPADPRALDRLLADGATVAVHDYADLIAGEPDTYPWPDVDERDAAAMCYTSGTTGEPKGVVYSHRSIYLHALGIALPDAFDLSAADRVLAVVPQFHVLAWGLPYAAFLTGASLAMPDRFLAAGPLAEFIAPGQAQPGCGRTHDLAGAAAPRDGRPERRHLVADGGDRRRLGLPARAHGRATTGTASRSCTPGA